MRIQKLLCLALTLVVLLTAAACGGPVEETTQPTETSQPAETQPVAEGDGEMSPPAEIIENPVENPIIYFSMSLGEDFDHVRYLVAYEDFGETYVEYVADEKKVGKFGLSLLHRLTEQVEAAELAALNGLAEYSEGTAMGSLYISYADGTYFTADFSGVIPDAFREAYDVMDPWFAAQTAHLDVYVPTPEIQGQVDETLKAEILAILEASGVQELDMLMISDIPLDDYFVFAAGLSSREGVVCAAQCSAMMMTTPYALTVVSAREEDDVQTIWEDFQESLDWHKWVCVMPTEALIAQKGNLVLCLLGADAIYSLTAAGIEATGWTEIQRIPNPDF